MLTERTQTIDENTLEFFEDINNRIDEYLNIDYILGTDKELTPLFINSLEKNCLSIEDGFIIRSLIKDALENNEIIPKSIILRTIYLMEHYYEKKIFEKIDDKIKLGNDIQEECPYCQEVNFSILEACTVCGYNLQRNNHFLDNFPKIISENLFIRDLIPECKIKEELKH